MVLLVLLFWVRRRRSGGGGGVTTTMTMNLVGGQTDTIHHSLVVGGGVGWDGMGTANKIDMLPSRQNEGDIYFCSLFSLLSLLSLSFHSSFKNTLNPPLFYLPLILAGEVLASALPFLERKIHPITIIAAYKRALEDALTILKDISVKVDTNNDGEMLRLIKSSIGTKFTSQVWKEGSWV